MQHNGNVRRAINGSCLRCNAHSHYGTHQRIEKLQSYQVRMRAHKKSSRKVRCPRGAEDDALKIPGAGGLEFDIESGILAITHRTLFNSNTTATCPHPCEQRTACSQQLRNQLPMQNRPEIENQMQSVVANHSTCFRG